MDFLYQNDAKLDITKQILLTNKETIKLSKQSTNMCANTQLVDKTVAKSGKKHLNCHIKK